MSGFSEGFAHPVVGLDHALAMVAVGMIAVYLGGRALWFVPAAFLVGMALGSGLGVRRIDLPNYEFGIKLSVVALGAMIASGRNLPLAVAAGLAGLFALCHGYAHGAEMPLNTSFAAYAVGFLAATAFLTAVGAVITLGLTRLGQDKALLARRVAGVCIAIAGMGMFAGVL